MAVQAACLATSFRQQLKILKGAGSAAMLHESLYLATSSLLRASVWDAKAVGADPDRDCCLQATG